MEGSITIKIDRRLKYILERMKIHPRQSMNEVIEKLIKKTEDLNTNSESDNSYTSRRFVSALYLNSISMFKQVTKGIQRELIITCYHFRLINKLFILRWYY